MLLMKIFLTLLIQSLNSLSSKLKCKNIKEYSRQGLTARSQSPTCVEPSDSQTSIFTVVPRGQLGNHLHAYALISALQHHYPHHQFLLSSETWLYLSTYFNTSHLLAPSINKLCLCKSYRGVHSVPWNIQFWNTDSSKDFVEVCISSVVCHQMLINIKLIYF